ncbi:MAG: tetratricopeptide repeat protein [Deltaproteobacteria bacterium]|nr:tetratricopeptide repeat protein [Deltaproteobacteria bacterium]
MKQLLRCLIIAITFGLTLFPEFSIAKTLNILVHPFENTGNKEFSWISAGMTDTVITDLARIKTINVVSNDDRKKIIEEMKFIFSGLTEEDKMMKTGKLIGANIIFTGRYLVSGDRIRVHARLVNVETGKVENTAKIDGTVGGIFDLQDKVVFALMGETERIQMLDIQPVKLTEEDKKAIEDKPRHKANAYEWYAKGLELQDTHPKEALVAFNKALDIDPQYTHALMAAGFTAAWPLNLFSEAFEYLERAEKVFSGRQETNTPSYARLMSSVGIVYFQKGQFDRALEYYLKAKSIVDRIGRGNSANYSSLMMIIGNTYMNMGKLDRALEYYTTARSIKDGSGLQNTSDYALLMTISGFAYWRKGQWDRALEYYTNAQSIWDRLRLQNTSFYAIVLMHIGNAYKDKGQLDRALEYCKNSLALREKLGLQNTVHHGHLLLSIGDIYQKKGQEDRAGQFFRKAYDAYVESGYVGKEKKWALKGAQRLGY